MTERQAFLLGCVEKHRQLIFDAERHIFHNPEPGFREWKTCAYLAEKFRELGYTLTEAGTIPGFYTDIDTGRPGPRVLVMGEMDALGCPNHPDAVDGIAHACGHNAQSAGLLGVAAALAEPGALEGLSGSIRLMAVPAEEMVQLEFRNGLRKQGIIRFLSGKAEFMARGFMKDVDMAVLIHTRDLKDKDFFSRRGSNGFVRKEVIYRGVAAHAASAPEDGVNALYAATLGLQAVNSLRETFREDQKIRVHGIITHGGAAANVIPDEVHLELAVRGAQVETIRSVAKKVDRALVGAAVSLGAQIEIHNQPGYTPLLNEPSFLEVFKECAEVISGPEKVNIDRGNWSTGSTDMGDMCAVMPTIQPYATGAVGKGHGADYQIADPEKACVNSAKAEILLLDALLKEDARKARKIISGFQAPFTQEEYIAYLDSCFAEDCPIEYGTDGTIRLFG
ncbi:MAG: amidohydrolase [Oscillospiraceae bacterium]|nr:amidohydrolase [Oscillospiraceae bacterium]